MATRASIKISNANGKFVANIYHHYDGYPEYLGQKLIDFIQSGKIVNGIRMGASGIQFNGFNDLAASLVVHLKDEIGNGNVYLYNEDDYGQCGEDYLYEIIENPDEGGEPAVLVMNTDNELEFVQDILDRVASID